MIHWKVSALSFAIGALTTVGFVWLRSRSRRRSVAEVPFDAEEAARLDALHDVGDHDLDVAAAELVELEPIVTESFIEETADVAMGGERYDAVDPEDVGVEWLQRATEAAAVDSTPGGAAEPPAEPADIAAELPVGSIDAEGNTELHEPGRPPTPPAELSSTDEELAQRRKAREEHADPKRHG